MKYFVAYLANCPVSTGLLRDNVGGHPNFYSGIGYRDLDADLLKCQYVVPIVADKGNGFPGQDSFSPISRSAKPLFLTP